MKKIFALIIFFILVLSNLNFAYAQDTEDDGGITPDNFILYKLDRAFEIINLLLTFDRAERAKLGLENARERILEAKTLIMGGNVEYLEKLKEDHKNSIEKVKEELDEIGEDDLEVDEELEQDLEEQEKELDEVEKEVEIKIKGKLTEEQAAKLMDFLESLGNDVNEVKIRVKDTKTKIKIKLDKIDLEGLESEENEESEGIEEKEVDEENELEIDEDTDNENKIEEIKTEDKKEETKSIVPPLVKIPVPPLANTGKEIFVRTNGDDNNPGTKDKPLKTLVKALELAGSGTTIKLGKGAYEGNYLLEEKNSGITITDEDDYCTKTSPSKAFRGNRPVVLFHKKVMDDGTDNSDAVFHLSQNVKNIRINCVSIIGGKTTGIWNDGGINFAVTQSEISDSTNSGIYESSLSTGSKYLNNYISKNGVLDNLDHGFYISGKDALIEGNIVENNYAFGIQVYPGPENVKVLNNECAYNGKSGIVIGAEPNPLEPEIVGSEPKIAKNILVKDNICHNNKRAGITAYNTQETVVFENNILFGNGEGGILLEADQIPKIKSIFRNNKDINGNLVEPKVDE